MIIFQRVYIFVNQLKNLVYNIFQLMKNQDFEIKLLVKQNTELSVRLQAYRKENQQLVKKNQNLNCWVQNLSEVFASISAAWKTITDNEQAFYTLMRKKTDPNAKAIVSKYIAHFKAFDQIVANLGDKITNQEYSKTATIDAKTRLTSFVNNYNLFFMEFVDSYFKFNDQYLAFINEKTEGQNIQAFMNQIKNKELENRLKIKQFLSYFTDLKEKLKTYENYNQHKLLDGIILEKNKEIDTLKDQNSKKSRKIAFMVDYSTHNTAKIVENEDVFSCSCGSSQLQYFNKKWQQSLKNYQNSNQNQSQVMVDEADENLLNKLSELQNLNAQKDLLLQRNVQCLGKLEKLKLQNKLTEEDILTSSVFLSLMDQFNQLIDYTNSLVAKLNKNNDLLNQLERIRLEQIQQLKKKYEKSAFIPKAQQSQPTVVIDHKMLINFKDTVLKELSTISGFYQSLCKDGKEREDKLVQVKELMKSLKKQNDDLNRKLNELQDKMAKSVDHLEYRHSKYNELQAKINQVFKAQPQDQECQRLRKIWQEYVDYVKTRDKKIKAMEDQIRKKQKELAQKNKLQQVLKTALAETETIYLQSKQKLDKFQEFKHKIEKQIINLSEENYKLKIQSEQEKNFLNMRIKNQVEIKAKLQQKAKNFEKIEAQVKLLKEKQIEIDRKYQQFNQTQKDQLINLKMQLKEKQKQVEKLNMFLQQKDKNIEKLLEDKEKNYIEINKLIERLKRMEQKTENEVLLMQLESYKSKIMCSCRAEREREVVLMTCPHIFCKKCIEDSVGNRNRKCPLCGIKFNKSDVKEIRWS